MERNKMAITKEQVLNNLQSLVGEPWSEDDVICCFEDCYGEELIIVNESSNYGYDYIAYADMEGSDQFLITEDEDGIMTNVWIA